MVQTYVLKRFGETVEYRVEPPRVRLVGNQLYSGRFDLGFDLANLNAEPNRYWARNPRKGLQVGLLVYLLLLIPLLIFVGYESGGGASRALLIGYWVGFGAIVLRLIFPGIIEMAEFRYSSGQSAFTVVKTRRAAEAYDTFVGALSTEILKSGRAA